MSNEIRDILYKEEIKRKKRKVGNKIMFERIE